MIQSYYFVAKYPFLFKGPVGWVNRIFQSVFPTYVQNVLIRFTEEIDAHAVTVHLWHMIRGKRDGEFDHAARRDDPTARHGVKHLPTAPVLNTCTKAQTVTDGHSMQINCPRMSHDRTVKDCHVIKLSQTVTWWNCHRLSSDGTVTECHMMEIVTECHMMETTLFLALKFSFHHVTFCDMVN